MVDGFWTVQFQGVQGWGSGVLTLIGGQLFGGDTSFLYTGSYTLNGNQLQARVHVSRFAQGLPNVMGREQFDLEISGQVQGNSANVVGTVPGTQQRLSATLTKRGELPPRAAAA